MPQSVSGTSGMNPPKGATLAFRFLKFVLCPGSALLLLTSMPKLDSDVLGSSHAIVLPPCRHRTDSNDPKPKRWRTYHALFDPSPLCLSSPSTSTGHGSRCTPTTNPARALSPELPPMSATLIVVGVQRNAIFLYTPPPSQDFPQMK